MPDVVSVRQAVQRAKADGLSVTEYSLRRWIKTGQVPVRTVGSKALLFYPNLVRFLQCEDGADNSVAESSGRHMEGYSKGNANRKSFGTLLQGNLE